MPAHPLNSIQVLQDRLPKLSGTEFVCIINKQGRIEEVITPTDINISKDKKEMFAMGLSLYTSMQGDFDDEFGAVHYTIIERENSRFVSIPTRIGILLAKLDKSIDPFVFVNTISVLFDLTVMPSSTTTGVFK